MRIYIIVIIAETYYQKLKNLGLAGRVGGIIGTQGNGTTEGKINIKNCCSTGKLEGETKGGIFGFVIFGSRELVNCYYLEETADKALNEYWGKHIIENRLPKVDLENNNICNYLNEYIENNIGDESAQIEEWCKWEKMMKMN